MGGEEETVERRRILLVDDNPNDVELALTVLRESGEHQHVFHDVSVAGSGSEALALLNASSPTSPLPDVILLDLKMPQMDGLAVLDAIRASASTRDIPVVMLTTSGEPRDISDSYAHGASAYVIKPLDFSQFREAMTTITAFWTQLNRRPHLR
ncbi:MAG: response regulator [Deinococcus sp.]|nr:response regulator [Deinococcus sp.]